MIDAISLQRIDTLHPRLIAEAKAILGEAQAAMQTKLAGIEAGAEVNDSAAEKNSLVRFIQSSNSFEFQNIIPQGTPILSEIP